MTASHVPTRIAGASGVIDIFLGPASILLALLFSLLIPVRSAHAQLSGTTGAASVDYAYQRTMSRMAAGTSAGLGISSPSTLGITRGARTVGSIALNERRVMSVGAMAARAVTLPGMIALGATLLLEYGLQKCADGSWCKPGTGEQAPNGRPYSIGTNYAIVNSAGSGTVGYTTSAEESCISYVPSLQRGLGGTFEYTGTKPNSGSSQYCLFRWDRGGGNVSTFQQLQQIYTGCHGGDTAVVSEGRCYPPGYTPGTDPSPASDAEIRDAWARAFTARPDIQPQLWSAEDQLAKDADWANAGVQPATVVGTGTVTDAQPAVSTTQDGKTTIKQTTCTYTGTPNTDVSTMGGAPLNVGESCVTTTTHPDGTQTQETTTTAPRPVGGDNAAPPKVEVETCGLPGKPACKIDETGTATEQRPETVAATTQAMDTALGQQRDAITNVLNSQKPDTNWLSWLPQIPRADCTPIEVEAVEGHTVSIDWCSSVSFMQVLSTAIWAFTCIGFSVAEVRDALNGS